MPSENLLKSRVVSFWKLRVLSIFCPKTLRNSIWMSSFQSLAKIFTISLVGFGTMAMSATKLKSLIEVMKGWEKAEHGPATLRTVYVPGCVASINSLISPGSKVPSKYHWILFGTEDCNWLPTWVIVGIICVDVTKTVAVFVETVLHPLLIVQSYCQQQLT